MSIKVKWNSRFTSMLTSIDSSCTQIRCGRGVISYIDHHFLTSLVEINIFPFIGNHKQSKIYRIWANSNSLEG